MATALSFSLIFAIAGLLLRLGATELRKRVLALLSLAFWWFLSPEAALWLTGVVVWTWLGGRFLNRSPESDRGRLVLFVAIGAPLGALLVLKFLPSLLSRPDEFWLPLGMSYYTFHCAGHLLDLFWRKCPPLPFLDLLLFAGFFPKAASGPIDRTATFIADLETKRSADEVMAQARGGFVLILGGLIMKFVIAERLGPVVDAVYSAGDQAGFLAGVAAIILYPWQLYHDFGGYTLIAIGAGRLCGLSLRQNFHRPFAAASVTEFWQRWHISLSSWFQDYVYTPLRFRLRRHRRLAVIVGMMTTFILVGIWHGAGTAFVVFGLLHGLAVTREALWARKPNANHSWARLWVGRVTTYAFVAITLALFRAVDLSTFATLLTTIGSWSPSDPDLLIGSANKIDILIICLGIASIEILDVKGVLDTERVEESLASRWRSPSRACLYALMITVLLVFGRFDHTEFIYARF